MAWKRGRGALGPLKPLLGDWVSEPAGPGPASGMSCTRRFALVLGGAYVQLEARWGKGGYEEIALFGKGLDGALGFASFTSDGKQSRGTLADGSDVHPDAVSFVAEMPAGLARMIYWPAEEDGAFYFAVESRTKKGWNRFFRHLYRAAR